MLLEVMLSIKAVFDTFAGMNFPINTKEYLLALALVEIHDTTYTDRLDRQF